MTEGSERNREAAEWQRGIWDRYPEIYECEVDPRFFPVVQGVIRRASLTPGQNVLDLGSGTGAVALHAAPLVAPQGMIVAVDISTEMLEMARRRAAAVGVGNITFREGGAESIPAPDRAFDALLASLSLMYAVDRAAAVREIARVLRPGGRFVAAVWAGPDRCDIVLFQQTAGRLAPPSPVPSIGPGALADLRVFLQQLTGSGLDVHVETETVTFDFPDFASAWQILAGVTTAQLAPQRREEAQAAVRAAMWPEGDGPRHFRNVVQFIVGQRRHSV
jgi:SAM-dependent methyltransferase